MVKRISGRTNGLGSCNGYFLWDTLLLPLQNIMLSERADYKAGYFLGHKPSYDKAFQDFEITHCNRVCKGTTEDCKANTMARNFATHNLFIHINFLQGLEPKSYIIIFKHYSPQQNYWETNSLSILAFCKMWIINDHFQA